MPDRVILIAEDDEDAVASWMRDVREFNRESLTVRYLPLYAKSKRQALDELMRLRIDCAVVDLRLPEDESDRSPDKNPTGNDVLESLLAQSGVPAVVYSGHGQEAGAFLEATHIKVMPKEGDGQMKVLRYLATFEGLMAAMEATQLRIARESAKLFHQAIWPRWGEAWTQIEDPKALAEIITRQIVSHVAESLGASTVLHHPEEFYLVPPLNKDVLGTGDMVTVGDQLYVVVTPRCNLARDSYPTNIVLALCKPMTGAWTELRNWFNGNADSRRRAADKIHSYATQGHSISTHFLPPCGADGPWLVDFKEIITVPSTTMADLLGSRQRAIAAQFVPNLVQRYAAYIGRIGQPDLDGVILGSICRALTITA